MTIRLCCAVGAAAVLLACEKPIPKSMTSSFDIGSNSYAFANFTSGYEASTLDVESMQRMFGDAVCKPGSSPCELTLTAESFANKANRAMEGGRCEGFAISALLMEQGRVDPTTFGGATARDLTLEDNPALQRELAYWFATQLHPLVTEKTKGYMAKNLMAQLAASFEKGATEKYRIGIVKKDGTRISGGHSLLPFGYFEDPNTPGLYFVRVYDNNHPDAERFLKVDVKNNRWEFEASSSPTEHSRLYVGDETNQNPVYLAPILVRDGVLPCFFCNTTKTQITSSGGAQVSLADGSGVAQGSLQGATTPQFSLENDEEGAAFTINADGSELSMTIVGDSTSITSAPQSVTVQGAAFEAVAEIAEADSTSTFAVGNAGKSLALTNSSRSDVTVRSVTEVQGKTVSVEATVRGESGVVNTSIDEMGVAVVTVNDAEGANVSVAVSIEAADGGIESGALQFTSTGDSSLGVNTTSLAMNGSLDGTLDNNGTMMAVTNACLDGQRSGTESDVDCGGSCTAKCALGKSCNSGGDCDSAACHATSRVCVATACEDGRKNGSESDVDCGGTCGSCATGKACGATADCGGFDVCAGSACAATYELAAVVNGLPGGATLELSDSVSSQSLTVTSNGAATFPMRIRGAYSVVIAQQPGNANCVLSNASGTATGNMSVLIYCTRLYAIGGMVSGLPAGTSVVLRNGTETLTVAIDSAFTFPSFVAGAYSVSVDTQPTTGSCSVSNGTGTATTDVTNVTVTCVTAYSIGGVISGLWSGASVTLNNNAEALVLSANGAFAFPTRVTAYNVTVTSQPSPGVCTVSGGSGAALADVTSISVACTRAGRFDTTFNTTGRYAASPDGLSSAWYQAVVNPDDSVVAVGTIVNGLDADWVVSKLTPAGALDSAFGTGGHLRISTGTFAMEEARAVVRNTDGTYFVMGTISVGTSHDFAVMKVTAAGALDATFATAGKAVIAQPTDDYVVGGAVDSSGRLVVVGYRDTNAADVVIVRLTAAGALDTSFGAAGFDAPALAPGETPYGMTIDPTTQDIIVVGSQDTNSFIMRHTNSGAPLAGFGVAGLATFDLSNQTDTDVLRSVAVSGTSLYATGQALNTGPTTDLVVIKVLANGTLDSTFATGGVRTINRGATDIGFCVKVGVGGTVLVAGSSGLDFFVTRLTAAGATDTTFGPGGVYTFNPGQASQAFDLGFDTQQRVVVVGALSSSVNGEFGAVRLFQ